MSMKVVVVGDSGVGKTALVNAYTGRGSVSLSSGGVQGAGSSAGALPDGMLRLSCSFGRNQHDFEVSSSISLDNLHNLLGKTYMLSTNEFRVKMRDVQGDFVIIRNDQVLDMCLGDLEADEATNVDVRVEKHVVHSSGSSIGKRAGRHSRSYLGLISGGSSSSNAGSSEGSKRSNY